MLRFHVIFTPSDEVLNLRRELEELKADHKRVQDELHRIEFRFCAQVNLQMQLGDWARENGVQIPPRFLQMV